MARLAPFPHELWGYTNFSPNLKFPFHLISYIGIAPSVCVATMNASLRLTLQPPQSRHLSTSPVPLPELPVGRFAVIILFLHDLVPCI